MASAPLFELVGIEKAHSVRYLELIFECYRSGRIAVPIDKDGTPPDGHRFHERVSAAGEGGWFDRAQAPIRDDRPAQLSFSSGTTGQPKAILLSHRALADVTDRLIDAMEIDAGIREYLGVPPTYSFGLARARVIAAVGGRLYLPPHGFDPGEFARMLADGEVNALAAVPTLLRVLLANPDLVPPATAARLCWLEIGSQPMSAAEKRGVRAMFPNARIIQHYGLTEASRTTFLDIQDASDDQLESVGRPIGATRVRIDDDGHVCIAGPHVADGLLSRTGLTPIVGDDGWLRTNDLGRIDTRGFLYFLGRADHLLNVGGIKVPAELFEERLLGELGPHDGAVAVAGVADDLRGQVVGIAHLPQVPADVLGRAIRAVIPGFGIRPADVRVAEVGAIPRTQTGKVQRGELGSLIASQAAAAAAAATARDTGDDAQTGTADQAFSARELEIAAIWRDALGLKHIAREDTFFDIGGDSLSAINVMLRMERAGVPSAITQQIFEGRTIAEIAAGMDQASGAAGDSTATAAATIARAPAKRVETSDAITMTRAVLVLLVVAVHWLPFVLVRMGPLSEPLLHYSYPVFRLGTPGFAMMYGLGLTFFNLSISRRNPDRFRANQRVSLLILFVGVASLATTHGFASYLDGDMLNPSVLLYGVLTTYLLLVASSGVILRFLAAREWPILAALLMAFTSLIVSAFARDRWGLASTAGFIDLGRLLIVAKYGYPQMLGYAGLGMAIGLWIDSARESPHLARHALLAGLVLLELAALLTISFNLEASWFEGSAGTQMIVAYCGAILLIFSGLLTAIRAGAFSGRLKVAGRLLLMTGMLAFMIYVGHEMSLHIHNIMSDFGVPYVLSLTVSVGTFVVALGVAMRRLYRLYYGG